MYTRQSRVKAGQFMTMGGAFRSVRIYIHFDIYRLKGLSNKIFDFSFFLRSNPPGPLTNAITYFV